MIIKNITLKIVNKETFAAVLIHNKIIRIQQRKVEKNYSNANIHRQTESRGRKNMIEINLLYILKKV